MDKDAELRVGEGEAEPGRSSGYLDLTCYIL